MEAPIDRLQQFLAFVVGCGIFAVGLYILYFGTKWYLTWRGFQ